MLQLSNGWVKISEAYRRWGIAPTTKDVIVVKVLFPTEGQPEPPTAERVWAHLSENVKGTPVPLTDEEIGTSTDLAKVQKYYKLTGAPTLQGHKDQQEAAQEMGVLALGGMALRGL
jgi:EKC/KEOPS complex subunit CGI121/TPRKB